MDYHLVGGFIHFLFSIIYRIVLPIDFHIFQRGRCTTNQSWITCVLKSLPTIVGIYIYIYPHQLGLFGVPAIPWMSLPALVI
jgi:hypothetical protein